MKRKKLVCLLTAFAVMIGMAGCIKEEKKAEKRKQEVELHILAAASMTDALTEISKTYKKEHENVKFVFNFDSSGTLKTQIEEGAPADIFISAAMKQMDELDKGGFIKKDSIVKLLENKFVLIQPKDAKTEISSFEDVATDKVSMVAIGNADVPVGQYTEQIYKNLGLWDQVAAKANLATNVRQVLDWVATNNVDCGIVYATDAMIEENVKVICEAPQGTCDPVIYPAGVVKSSENAKAAEQFMEYLKTDEAKSVFTAYGFTNYEE